MVWCMKLPKMRMIEMSDFQRFAHLVWCHPSGVQIMALHPYLGFRFATPQAKGFHPCGVYGVSHCSDIRSHCSTGKVPKGRHYLAWGVALAEPQVWMQLPSQTPAGVTHSGKNGWQSPNCHSDCRSLNKATQLPLPNRSLAALSAKPKTQKE